MSTEANVIPADVLPFVTLVATVAAKLASQDRGLAQQMLSEETRGKRLGYHLDNAVALVHGAYARLKPVREDPTRIIKPVPSIAGLNR